MEDAYCACHSQSCGSRDQSHPCNQHHICDSIRDLGLSSCASSCPSRWQSDGSSLRRYIGTFARHELARSLCSSQIVGKPCCAEMRDDRVTVVIVKMKEEEVEAVIVKMKEDRVAVVICGDD
jgi:hypothetical protein